MNYSRLYLFLFQRWWAAFLLLGVSFVIGSVITLNLLHVLIANFQFLSMFGIQAIRDGGLLQLTEIVVSGYFAAGCYVIFKMCEKILVERLSVNKRK